MRDLRGTFEIRIPRLEPFRKMVALVDEGWRSTFIPRYQCRCCPQVELRKLKTVWPIRNTI